MPKESPEEAPQNKTETSPGSGASRYIRQIILNEIGVNGQLKLKTSSVLVVGCGGLGAPVLHYLAAAGVGCIGFSDSDAVEESNLNRQVLFGEKDIGIKKTEVALHRLKDLNSSLKLRTHPEITQENVTDICIEYDIVLDCADSRSLRYLLSNFCARNRRPFICGSSLRWEGSIYVLTDICFRCVHPVVSQRPLATCASAGLLGGVCGAIGSLMAVETIKWILGTSRSSSVLHISALDNEYIWVPLRKKPCEICMSAKHNPAEKKETPTLKPAGSGETSSHSPQKEKKHSEHPKAGTRSIRWHEILESSDQYLLVDIRTSTEHSMLIHPGALKCPLDILLNNPKKAISVAEKTAKGKKIALVCRNGSSSAKFAALFGALTVTGGMQEYFAASRTHGAGPAPSFGHQ